MLSLEPSLWSRVYSTKLNAKPVLAKPTQSYPIPDLRMPVAFDAHTLLVGASSFMVKPTWRLAFWLSGYVKILGVGQPEFGKVSIPLGLSLIQVPKLVSTYNLIAKFPHWHKQMVIDIWQYKGVEPPSLESLREDLSKVQSKVGVNTAVLLPGQIPGIFF